MGGFILWRRDKLLGNRSWATLVFHAGVAAAIYAVLFLVAMDRKELNWYFNKMKEMFRRGSVATASSDLKVQS
jgi:hypothetical protein